MSIVWNARQQQMLERLEADGEIKVAEMKELFGVTEMTIRRDLEKLEQAGAVRRTFGGAILVGKDVTLQDRSGVLTDEKICIGRKAAELVQPGDSIFIDGGSTTLQLARALKPGMDITVVTNALNVAGELMEKRIPTIVAGGIILESTSTLVGPIACETIGSMAFNRIFLGATGVSGVHGFSNSNVYEAEIKKLAIRQASEVNIVLDHSKFGANVLISFAELSKAQRIITDRLPDQELLDACREAGIELLKC
ncbi:DeoR/GlpR family DNA-binding transcription regulator [Paenibacillus sp. GCM10027626]|uniref:DeoR/GlpR family DNA-binding transcription regulator n=1 Tax=Paenibacillus sp. GCM10027626 TaxID=3273411 RepID=UPI003636D3A2